MMASVAYWKNLGFRGMPRPIQATGEEVLFRVFDGATSELYGSYYTQTRPDSVSDAEFNLNVIKFGNRCLYVASFNVLPGAPLLVGRVDPTYENRKEDDGVDVFVWGNFEATQVYIEKTKAKLFLEYNDDKKPLRRDFTPIQSRQRLDA